MNYKKILLLGIAIATIFISGCVQQSKQETIICNSPYMKVGTECCLDQNSNNICDKDESKGVRLDICIKTYVAGKCTTDSDCIQKSKQYCGDLLTKGCEFGPMGVTCS